MELYYLIPEKIFMQIKQYIDGYALWREKDGLIEIRTPFKSRQEFLNKLTLELKEHGSS